MQHFLSAILVYSVLIGLSIFLGYQMIRITEYTICVFRRRIPFVASPKHLRMAVVNEIKAHYPNTRRVCEIGSGYGGMARTIARKCDIEVDALENMPICVIFSRIADFFTRTRSHTIWCDAFDYMEKSEPFDVAIAYLGPGVNDRVASYNKHFKTLILLDVPAEGIKPTRVIPLKKGGTRYGRHYFPHKLFVYDFNK